MGKFGAPDDRWQLFEVPYWLLRPIQFLFPLELARKFVWPRQGGLIGERPHQNLALAASNAQLLRFVAKFVGWYSFFSEF